MWLLYCLALNLFYFLFYFFFYFFYSSFDWFLYDPKQSYPLLFNWPQLYFFEAPNTQLFTFALKHVCTLTTYTILAASRNGTKKQVGEENKKGT